MCCQEVAWKKDGQNYSEAPLHVSQNLNQRPKIIEQKAIGILRIAANGTKIALGNQEPW